MPVSKGRKKTLPKSAAARHPATRPKTWPTKKSFRFWAVVLGGATLISVPSAVFALWPRMTVVASGLYDESNAYSQTFVASNTGFLPFKDVQLGIGICEIETEKHDFAVTTNNCEGGFPRVRLGAPHWWAPELTRDEPFSIVLSDGLNIPTQSYRASHPNVVGGWQMLSGLKAANVIVVANFRAWPAPQKIEKKFRFVAEQEPNGKVIWRPVPLSWRNLKLP